MSRKKQTALFAFINPDGIIEILVWINEGKSLAVGDDVMYLVVAGDIRETVIGTLTDTLNQIKSEVTSKKQYFKG